MNKPGSQNPYQAPGSKLEKLDPGARPVVAILIGYAVATGLIYPVSTILSVGYMRILMAQGVAIEQLYDQAFKSAGLLASLHLGAFLGQVAGGYWTARLSEHGKLANAACAGLLAMAFEAFMLFHPYDFPLPAWSSALSFAIPVPAFLIGAAWNRRRNRIATA